MSHWMTSGASRLKAKQNRTFAARAQQRAAVVAADRINTRGPGSMLEPRASAAKTTTGVSSSISTCYARPKGRRRRIAVGAAVCSSSTALSIEHQTKGHNPTTTLINNIGTRKRTFKELYGGNPLQAATTTSQEMPHFGPTLPPLRKIRESWEQSARITHCYPQQQRGDNGQYASNNSQQAGAYGEYYYQGQQQVNSNPGYSQVSHGSFSNPNSFSSHSSDNSTQCSGYPVYADGSSGRYFPEQHSQRPDQFRGGTHISPNLHSKFHNDVQQQSRENYQSHTTNATLLSPRQDFSSPSQNHFQSQRPQPYHQEHGNKGIQFPHRNNHSPRCTSSMVEQKDTSDRKSSFGSHTSPDHASWGGHNHCHHHWQQDEQQKTGLRLPPRYHQYQYEEPQQTSPRSDFSKLASAAAPASSGLKLPRRQQKNPYRTSTSSSMPRLSPSQHQQQVDTNWSSPPAKGSGLKLPKKRNLEGTTSPSMPFYSPDNHNRGMVHIESGGSRDKHLSKAYSTSPAKSIFRMRNSQKSQNEVLRNNRLQSPSQSKSDTRTQEVSLAASSNEGRYDSSNATDNFQSSSASMSSSKSRGIERFRNQGHTLSGMEECQGSASFHASPNLLPKTQRQQECKRLDVKEFQDNRDTSPTLSNSFSSSNAEQTPIRYFNNGIEVGFNGVPLSISIERNDLATNDKISNDFEPPSDRPENETDELQHPLEKFNRNDISKSPSRVEQECPSMLSSSDQGQFRNNKRRIGKNSIVDKYYAKVEENEPPHLQSEENLVQLEETKKMTADILSDSKLDHDIGRRNISPFEDKANRATSSKPHEKAAHGIADIEARITKKPKLDSYNKKQKTIKRTNSDKSQSQPNERRGSSPTSGMLSNKDTVGHGNLMRDIFGPVKTGKEIGTKGAFMRIKETSELSASDAVDCLEESNQQTVNAANVLLQMATESKTNSIVDID